MSSKQTYFVMLGVIALLFVALLGGAYGANKILIKRSTTLVSLRAKTQAQSQEQSTLSKAKKDIATYSSLQQIVNDVVPEDKDQAQTVREISNIAAQNNISLSAITFPVSTLGTATGPTAATTITPGNTAASALTNPNSTTSLLSQLQPVKTIPGVYVLVITVQSDENKPVEYSKFITFLAALEHNRRTAQVTNISIQPNTSNRSLLSFSLNLNEYIKP